MNQAILIGNLGNDPILKDTNGGASIANFSLATSEKQKDKDKERTEWHRVVAFGRLAELAAKHLRKGSKCLVVGRIQSRTWEDKKGIKQSTTEIVAFTIKFLDGKTSAEESIDEDEGYF
jgi:single-strand DNA-binding protein